MESNPSLDAIPALLAELDADDPEHPDVALSDESGWTLSVFPSGRVIWENVEEDDEARHLPAVGRTEAVRLLSALAAGQVDEVDSTPGWQTGYGS
jgi:hypothetical protein